MFGLFMVRERHTLVLLTAASIAAVLLVQRGSPSAEPPVVVAIATAWKPTLPPLLLPPRVVVRGQLLEDSTPVAGCGRFEVWTVLHFDVSSFSNAERPAQADVTPLPVAVPCTEMPRSSYSETAGNAGVLVKGRCYVLTLDPPASSGRLGNLVAWTAERIDALPWP